MLMVLEKLRGRPLSIRGGGVFFFWRPSERIYVLGVPPERILLRPTEQSFFFSVDPFWRGWGGGE